jgi:hypothetical protein
MVSDNKLKARFFRFMELVEKIRSDVEARCGSPIYIRFLPESERFALCKREECPQYGFANILPRVKDKLCRIATKAEWAIKAEVQDSKDHMLLNGWHNCDDAYYWDVKALDDERYKEIIRAVSKICQVRN